MDYMKLNDGSEIDKTFFKERLEELKQEKWELKDVSKLGTDHVNCELTFETISPLTSLNYYESNQGSIVSIKAYEKYIEK